MEQDKSMSFSKQLLLIVISMTLGSFVFIGVIENYKNDEIIKIKQLEDYFNPTRKSASSCLGMQNELFLHYPQNWASLQVVFDELDYLSKNSSVNVNAINEVVLNGYFKTMFDVIKTNNELPLKVKKCREEVYLQLETLSIVTGSFEYFSEVSRKRNSLLNALDKKYRASLREGVSRFEEVDLQVLMRKFGELEDKSEEASLKLVLELEDLLPFIKMTSMSAAKTEEEKYKIESDFFSAVRQETASRINNRFKQGFFSWLF